MKFLVGIIISLSSSLIQETSSRNYFVIWNVGQGQWLTQVSAQSCLHFDFGGEFFPLQKARTLCHNKDNMLFLSHWDWDHIGGLTRLRKMSSWCLAMPPAGPTNRGRRRLIERLPVCHESPPVKHWKASNLNVNSNGRSHVFLWKGVLIPGDSTRLQEKQWAFESFVQQGRTLILGHHGSATSTSEALLRQMPALRLSIVSARWARHKHPHPRVLALLKKYRVPVLRTEDWGNIWIESQ